MNQKFRQDSALPDFKASDMLALIGSDGRVPMVIWEISD
jgi:hypothetical protein